MKRRRFKAQNCRAACLLAKAFGVSAANSGTQNAGRAGGQASSLTRPPGLQPGASANGRQASRLSRAKDDSRDGYLPNAALCLAEIDALLEHSRLGRGAESVGT